MTLKTEILLIVVSVIFLITIISLIKKKALHLQYALLWIAVDLLFFVLIIFPNLLKIICDLCGIVGSMNGLFIFAIMFLLLLLFSLTVIVSKQSSMLTALTQEQAILKEKIIRLEEAKKDK